MHTYTHTRTYTYIFPILLLNYGNTKYIIPYITSHENVLYSLTTLKVFNSIVLLGKSCEYLNDSKSTTTTEEPKTRSEPTSPKRSKSKEDLPTYVTSFDNGQPENLACHEVQRSNSLEVDRLPILKIDDDIKAKSSQVTGMYQAMHPDFC